MVRRVLLPLLMVVALLMPRLVSAHDLFPGFLELQATGASTYQVLWKLPLLQGQRLPIAPRFPDDCALQGAPDSRQEATALVYEAELSCREPLEGRVISMDGLASAGTEVLLRVRPWQTEALQTLLIQPEQPEAVIPTASEADQQPGVWSYLRLGIEHILLGVDHLLLLLGLVLIVRDGWMLLKTVTAFTLANSITLSVSAIGIVQVPAAPLNAAIALSILFIGTEVVRFMRGQTSFTLRHPWVLACGFGLLHGFGYARGLAELGLPHHELLLALLLFNVGIEIGQDVFVVLVLALERAFRQLQIRWPLWVRRVPAWTIGCAGAYWTIETTVSLIKGGV